MLAYIVLAAVIAGLLYHNHQLRKQLSYQNDPVFHEGIALGRQLHGEHHPVGWSKIKQYHLPKILGGSPARDAGVRVGWLLTREADPRYARHVGEEHRDPRPIGG